MQAIPKTKQPAQLEQPADRLIPDLENATAIGRRLGVTGRYVHMLAERHEIPAYRFGKACIRFNPEQVYRALGIIA